MKVRFNVKCRVDGKAYQVGDEADLTDYDAQTLLKLHRGSQVYVTVIEPPKPAPAPKPAPKKKAVRKAKPKAKRKKETATE